MGHCRKDVSGAWLLYKVLGPEKKATDQSRKKITFSGKKNNLPSVQVLFFFFIVCSRKSVTIFLISSAVDNSSAVINAFNENMLFHVKKNIISQHCISL